MSLWDGRIVGKACVRHAGLPFLALMAAAPKALAAPLVQLSAGSLTAAAMVATGLVLTAGFSIFAALRFRTHLAHSRERIADLELLLNEAEVSLLSEPQVLVIWRSGEAKPERLINNMRGTAQVPTQSNEILAFADWLERDSNTNLVQSLAELRDSGRAFNIGIKTLKGELLEADGRAAGGLATLRIRPLVGDRRQMTELAFDASKLGKQVERLSSILDSAPFPAWIHGKDGILAWANQAYVAAVEATSFESAQRATSLMKASDIDTTRADPSKYLLGRVHAIQQGNRRAYNIHQMPVDGGVAGFAIDVTSLENAEKELDRHIRAHTSTLDKLDTRRTVPIEMQSAAEWWRMLTQRYAHEQIEFHYPVGALSATLPPELFDSVADNLVQNALEKRRRGEAARIQVVLEPIGDRRCRLQVNDDGQPMGTVLAARLFREPVVSETGLGVGLYQAARQAANQGYRLRLAHNRAGNVAFTLEPE